MLLLYLVWSSPVAPAVIENSSQAAAGAFRSFLSDLWAIWYNLVLSEAEHQRLMGGLRTLHALSASVEKWSADPFSVM